VNDWIKKNRVPGDTETLARLATALQCSMAWLMLGDKGVQDWRDIEMERASGKVKVDRRKPPLIDVPARTDAELAGIRQKHRKGE
jgi:hypothetical protein